ncbi:glycerol transporter [Lithohypha guttulata]|uniref:glycerol transporter n=1 Tax=Lithohypha guttulata TaxID=1690604 RepID=UPI002DE02DE7|nr:glycerol transporter [Lithohypha guttulata]
MVGHHAQEETEVTTSASLRRSLRAIYSLDTLDTRLTTSSKTPSKDASKISADTAVDGPKRDKDLPEGASPSKWTTPEFGLYTLVFVISVPLMYKAVWDVSQPESKHYKEYASLLSDGWLFGRKVDNSDSQYAGFRDNVPYLAILLVVHPLLRRAYNLVFSTQRTSSTSSASERLSARANFDFVSGLVFITALHGFSASKVLTILYINYCIAMRLPRDFMPSATWMFNVGVLFANELAQGYRFTSIAAATAPFYAGAEDVGKFLDSFGGLIPRWEVLFNITILRLIAFNMDYFWSLSRDRAGSPIEKKQLDPSALSERDRVSIPAPESAFTSFKTYLAYVLYPPLYLAGPILNFNDYISQSTYQSASINTRRTTLYAIRFLLTLFCMEFLLHTTYVVAISKSNPDWLAFTPFQLSMLAYFNLHVIWLKLLIPWRFFRLWSLIDGIDPVENVVRCMSDNYSALSFWRAWHRSFNRWIVRYLYVPLGGGPGGGTGAVRGTINMLAVFTFVALWHDINLQLLAWGWLIVFFVLPEILATIAFPKSKWRDRPTTYRMICGVGAVFNIMMMMAANLVGFAVGLDGLKGLVTAMISSTAGLLYTAVACSVLFVGAQVMFEHREEEKRKGIFLKF